MQIDKVSSKQSSAASSNPSQAPVPAGKKQRQQPHLPQGSSPGSSQSLSSPSTTPGRWSKPAGSGGGGGRGASFKDIPMLNMFLQRLNNHANNGGGGNNLVPEGSRGKNGGGSNGNGNRDSDNS